MQYTHLNRLVLLALASQRIETDIFDFDTSNVTKRGSPPTLIELLVLPWVLGKTSFIMHVMHLFIMWISDCMQSTIQVIMKCLTKPLLLYK